MLTDYHHDLQCWYQTQLGKLVWSTLTKQVQSYTAEFFGHQLLNMGSLGLGDWLQSCPITSRTQVADTLSAKSKHFICAQVECLPFANDSVDAIIVPHALEAMEAPEVAVQEFSRVLIPQGNLLIVGFNPVSLWGLLPPSFLPTKRHLIRVGAIRHMLTAAGCTVDAISTCYYGPPRQQTTAKQAKVWETLGRLGWPSWGAVYMIHAHKQVCPVTPIRPRWLQKTAFEPPFCEASVRRSSMAPNTKK